MFEFFNVLFIVVCVFLIAFFLGIKMCLQSLSDMETDRFVQVVKALREDDAPTDFSEVIPKKNTRITLTAANDILLAHDALTGEFLAQGSNTVELLKTAFSRFPDKQFTIAVDIEE